MRHFYLVRHEDLSGKTGTGVVAQGTEYEQGWVTLQWLDSDSMVPAIFESVDTLLGVHGHAGKTTLRWASALGGPVRSPIAEHIVDLDRLRHSGDYGQPRRGTESTGGRPAWVGDGDEVKPVPPWDAGGGNPVVSEG